MDGRRLGMAENDTGRQPLGVMVFVIGWGQTSAPAGPPMGLGRGLWQALQWHAHGIAATSTASHSEIRTEVVPGLVDFQAAVPRLVVAVR
jgi:hypothetical protein